MEACSGFCQACNSAVRLVVRNVSRTFVLTAILGAGVAGGLGRQRYRLGRGLLGAVVGAGLGLIAHAVTGAAQKWVCGDCGCTDVVVN